MDTVPSLTLELEVLNRAGIHTRVALMIFKKMQEFQAEARLSKGGASADCRSVLDLLSLGAANGEKVILSVKGEDAEPLQKAIASLFESRFYEDESPYADS